MFITYESVVSNYLLLLLLFFFFLREKDYIQQEDFRLQQMQEKDQEYNALVKILKDRV